MKINYIYDNRSVLDTYLPSQYKNITIVQKIKHSETPYQRLAV